MEWKIRFNNKMEDPEWDAFVDASPCGHYSQTCAWAQLKSTQGWQVLRLLLYAVDETNEQLFGGAQILHHRKAPLGRVGYLSKGPLFLQENTEAQARLFNEITAVCRRENLFLLALQPPDFCHRMTTCLQAFDFSPLPYENICPPGTALIDLTQSLDEIMMTMCKNKRRKIHFALRHGVVVRPGTETDIPSAYALMQSTAHRQEFCPHTLEYLQTAWQFLEPQGKVQLFIAEYESQPLSVMFTLRQGETLTLWKAGWCGEADKLQPNNALYWGIIEWAKAQGIHWLDLGSLNRETAEALASGADLPREAMTGVDMFKMEFNGQVVFHPETLVYLRSKLLRRLLHWMTPILPRIMDLPLVEKAVIHLALNA